jgi:acyl carrier protein
MMRREIASKARLVIAREAHVPLTRVTEHADFRSDLGARTLGVCTLMMALEQEFGIDITERETSFCETVGTVIDLIELKLENLSNRGGAR